MTARNGAVAKRSRSFANSSRERTGSVAGFFRPFMSVINSSMSVSSSRSDQEANQGPSARRLSSLNSPAAAASRKRPSR